MRLMGFWVLFVVLRKWGVESFELDGDLSESSSNTTSFWESMSMLESVYGISGEAVPVDALMVKLTLIERAAAMGAVCLDGSSPGYHLHRGSGEGANNWLIQLEGGGWCNSISACKFRKTTRLGSSRYFQKKTPFIGILSNKAYENPDFYNWNRVKVRYCDGGSFAGNSENRAEKLKFRGKLIWEAAMKELMLKGMKNASQALLSGCSAGGLASILHCDKFRSLFHRTTTVKCLSDAGLFLDVGDVSGGHTLRRLFDGVVRLQNVRKRLSGSCPKNLGRTSCFFPQNLIANIKTPLFMLNAAYDSWQIKQSLTPSSADREGKWQGCRNNYTQCTQSQIKFLHGFRSQMVNATKDFAESKQNGLFLNSCFSHGQSERQDTWYAANSPTIDNRSIAKAVGDWYFDRTSVMCIGCEACNETCRNLVFK